MRHQEIEGYSVAECQICEALQGDPDELARIEEIREGDALHYDREIFPLVKTLEMITGFKVFEASAGDAAKGAAPFIHFKIHGPKARRCMEKLMTSLTMTNRELPGRWMVEVTLLKGLSFTLKPSLARPGEPIDETQLTRARQGIELLTRATRRNMNLSWWHELED